MSDDKIPVQELAPAEVSELAPDQRREKIYTRKIEGFYQRLRLFTGWPLLLGYFILPWINWGDHPAILFDLPARQFHIFGLTLWPQDFPLLAWLLIIAAFALFTVTVFAGRVWCGYTCPQTVWTAMFMWAEQFCEGSRNQRIKRDQGPWDTDKILRKSAKHGMWLVIAFWTGFTFVAYFSPAREMIVELLTFRLNLMEVAWIVFFTCATYINAGWLREQVCLYMCPYARFQAVMFDSDTLIVSYDKARGEPRGARKRDSKPEQLGDCIDCQLCVQVCPTGIDIRNGLQYECITCALCIDACDSVMDKMQYPRGLIRYTTETALSGGKTHILRPRLLGYAAAVVIMLGLFATALLTRIPLELEVLRDRDQVYRETVDGAIENVYTVKLLNKDGQSHRYALRIEGPAGIELRGRHHIDAEAGELVELPLRLSLPPGHSLNRPAEVVRFIAEAADAPLQRAEAESRFLGPRL